MNETLTTCEVYYTSQHVLQLGHLATRFARVERAPRMPDGRFETDVEHSFHLALTATELAARHYPELDTGLISQYSMVHDLVEVMTGDVRTFDITDEERARKEEAERNAAAYLVRTLPTHTATMLKRYEEQEEPEARFVRLVDKLLPNVINYVASEAATFLDDYGVSTLEELQMHRERQVSRLREMFPEYSKIIQIREHISKLTEAHFFPGTHATIS